MAQKYAKDTFYSIIKQNIFYSRCNLTSAANYLPQIHQVCLSRNETNVCNDCGTCPGQSDYENARQVSDIYLSLTSRKAF